MRIQKPTITAVTVLQGDGASLTGSFSGSFVGWDGITGKPDPLISSSAQIGSDISGSFVSVSASIAADIAALDANYATDAALYAATASLSSSLAVDIATKANSSSFASDIATNVTNITNIASFTASLDTDITTLSIPANTTISAFGATLVDDANAAAAIATLGLDADIATLSVPASTTISAFGATLVDDADASAARATLGVDAAGTDNSTNVTLVTTSHDYLSISGQAVTLGTVDISDDTNLTAGTGVTLTGDTISIGQDVATTANVTFGSVAVTNNVTITGDLSVLGNAVEIQVGALSIEDKNILVASGAADSAAADGAGITIGGANETITWNHANSRFNFSDDVHAEGNITLTGTVDGRDVATDGTKLDGIEAGADVTDATNVAAAGAIMDGDFSSNGFMKRTGAGTYTIDSNTYLTAHPTITAASSVDNTGRTYIQDITLDSNGHVIGIASATETVTDTNTTYSAGSGIGLTGTTFSVAAGGGLTQDASGLSHTDTSTQASVSNTGRTYIQSITLDTYGHITAISSGTETVTDTNTTYSAGTNLNLTGTTFSIPTSTDFQIDSLGVGTAAPGTTGVIRATNDIVAYYSSDERLKDNIKPLEGALDKVNAMGGYEFDWNDNQEVHEGHDIGVIAQEVQAQYPELVHERDNGYLAVDYVKLTAVLLQAVKELSAKVDQLSK